MLMEIRVIVVTWVLPEKKDAREEKETKVHQVPLVI